MAISTEQPPQGTDKRLAEYLVRLFGQARSEDQRSSQLPILTVLPLKPKEAKIYYFGVIILPNITAKGYWGYDGANYVRIG